MKLNRVMATIFGLVLFWGTGLAAQAQQAATAAPATAPSKNATAAKGQGNADAPEEDESLHLSDDQKARIAATRDDAKLQVQDAYKDKTLTDDQRDRKLKQIYKETRARVFAVLTPDQQKAWGAEQRERREAKSQGHKTQ